MTIGTTRLRFVGPEPITPEMTMSFGFCGLFGRLPADGVGCASINGRPDSSATLMFWRTRAWRAGFPGSGRCRSWAASWCGEGAPREEQAEDDEERARDERRTRDPRARAASPAVHQLDEDPEPREDAEADTEREAAGPRRRGHEQPVPDEEGDQDRPVHEEHRVRRALQEAREDRKPEAARTRGERHRYQGHERRASFRALGVPPGAR